MPFLARLIFLLVITVSFTKAGAQEIIKKGISKDPNVIKLNISALAVKNISVQYERQLGKRVTAALNVHFIPYGSLPYVSRIANAVNQPLINFDKMSFGNIGVTPELRYYMGLKPPLRGFYMSAFVNYNNYKMNLPVIYGSAIKKTGIFTGNISSLTAGVQFGIQWRLTKCLVLDWWIIGPNFGFGKGHFDFAGKLDSFEQTDLRDALEQLKRDAPFSWIEGYTVNAEGANVQVKGPWVGLRGLGFNLGFRF